MLRAVLLLLVLANLLFFAWAQGYLGAPEEGREPQRLGMQIAPEKLQVDVLEPPSASLSSSAESCRMVRGLAPNEAQRLLAQAREKLPELKMVLKANQAPTILHWVYIPPLANKFALDKKLQELNKLGVSNFSALLDEGPDKFAISLGLFNTEKEAQAHFQDLLKRGVRSARIQMRENLLGGTQLEVRGPADVLAKQLPGLLSVQANSRIADCPSGPGN